MSLSSKASVVVVGAGPAGLTTACTLLQAGVHDVVVIDAAAQASTASRATVIHSRTLEVLDELQLSEKVLAQGDKITKWDICDKQNTLVELDFSLLQCKYPMVVTLPQSETEAILEEQLTKLGGKIFRGARVTKVVDEGDAVHLEVEHEDVVKSLTADYVVAADGLKSTIRTDLGIPFEGGEYTSSFITADCRMSSIGDLKPDAVQLYLAPAAFLLLIPEPHNIWRIVATLDPAPPNADVALYQKLVDERAGAGIKIEELTWTSRFHIHHRLARKYRKNRIFLAGDAAHVHSPAGGQGMNIGIQDGRRLGEILAEAVRDQRCSNADLDRYERERRPVAQGVVGLTHRITVMATLKSPWLSYLRDCFIWAVMKSSWMRYWMAYTLAELEH